MAALHEVVSDTEVVLGLAPEELALIVLDELAKQETRSGTGNPHCGNFSRSFSNRPQPVQRALMEAWDWLRNAGALATEPQQDPGWVFVTRRGHELLESGDSTPLTLARTLPRQLLHPSIEQKAWSAYIRGEYDTAVFVAFKQLEVGIRSAGQFGDDDIGTKLARAAFNVDTGPLSDMDQVPAERQALSDLMAGALGSYKNPHSHRNVPMNDAAEAAEMLVLASHLLKIVDARQHKPKNVSDT